MREPKNLRPEKTSYNPPFLRIISVVTIIYLAYYLWWRATSTLNPNALIFSWVLLLAEGFGAFTYVLFAWITQDISPTRKLTPPKPGITVDVFIPTYNESVDILEATMIGCQKITYPHTTYVLDDGNREAVKQLALHLGCRYLTRWGNWHAKAGNINHALTETSGEFIVLVDADTVPQPEILDRTLGYFEDDKLAVIQMPQEFYNWDSIQHDQKALRWHEQSLFYRVIQAGKNHSNSGFWCGSPSIVRRKALQDVNGVARGTITEDIETSVLWHSRGWSSYFVNEPLAYGIAPETVQSFLVQRLRWARGTMQLYRGHDSPLWIKGLSFAQRVSYLASWLAYFEAFQKLILIFVPAIIILSNVFPMKVGAYAIILRWGLYFAISMLANMLGGRGYYNYFQTEKYNLLKMAVFIQATPVLLQRKSLAFEVTPKSFDLSVYTKERRSLRTHFIILACISGAILFGLVKVGTWPAQTVDRPLYLIALGWAAYNAVLVLTAIRHVLRKPHERKDYRFRVSLPGAVFEENNPVAIAPAHIRDLSISGVGFDTNCRIAADRTNLQLRFDIPGDKHIVLPLSKFKQHRSASGKTYMMGASLSDVGSTYRERLFEYLFVSIPGTRFHGLEKQPKSGNQPSGLPA